MKLEVVDEARFAELVGKGEIVQEDCQHLDGLKVGLRVRSLLQPVTLEKPVPPRRHTLPISVQPGHFYLGLTVERLAISPRLFGWIHTRSTWARRGLDCLSSSTYIAPGYGYGSDGPLPLTLEISSHVLLTDFPPAEPVAAFVLFELERPVRPSSARYFQGTT